MKTFFKQSGFSIIELLFAMVFLTTVSGAIIPLFTKSIAANNAARKKLYAYQTAHAEIEKMRNDDFSNLSDHNFTISGISNATGNIETNDFIDGQERDDILEVTATVTWLQGTRNETIEIVSYIAEKGMY